MVSTRTGGELLELEDTYGAVPDDGLTLAQLSVDQLGGLGALVKTHPAIGDGIHGDNLQISLISKTW